MILAIGGDRPLLPQGRLMSSAADEWEDQCVG
jgi:hypothetical protein